MQILDAIIHHIEKDRHGIAHPVVTRSSQLPIDDRLIAMTNDILKIYGRTVSGYGTFNSDRKVYTFPDLLNAYTTKREDFILFTQSASRLIRTTMARVPLATGGYPLFLRFTNQGQDWVLIAMLKLKAGTGINQSTLDLSDTLSFDVSHLHEAVRINIQKWQSDDQPYLSFVKKKRSSSQEISHYFLDALGCTDYTDSKANTATVLSALTDYCEDHKMTPEQRIEARRRTYEYCEEKNKVGEPVNLSSLSSRINDQEPESFSNYVRDGDYEIGETFEPNRDVYSRLKRIKGRVGNTNVSFDVVDIQSGNIDLDKSNNLIIRNVPATLAAEIRQHQIKITVKT
ncbi:nucleoid-associated protein [Aeromonas allosaccharophila]|uniref:nucleoid-associated protein n=1 Tax=Aeromonas allosaccharophila TaxID=656 RepID=UPI000DD0D5DB|nr:nucleoid-associated protein [Aeromonas allosaccharophila]